MSKLDLEEPEEPEIKLPTSVGSSKKQESASKASTSALLTMPNPLTVWITTHCRKFCKRWEYQNPFPASWEIYMQVRRNRTGHGTTDWFQIGKGVRQGCILLPCLFNLYAEYIMRNAGLDEAQAGIKIAGRNVNNLRYADDTTLMAESKELKSFLMKVKEESKKLGLKLNMQKNKIMASSPITSWQIHGETVIDFILGGSKITADGDFSHEIKKCLLLGSKVMTSLYSILKSRGITLPTKVRLVKAMVFPVVMYGCESWTIKKAECQRIAAFELWCWRRPLRVPWTARRSNQSILKKSVLNIHWKNWCWSWNSNTLATWCEELTHLKRPWCWDWLKAGGEGDNRGWDGWMASPTQWTWVWVSSGSWWRTGRPGVLQFMGLQRVRHDWATKLTDWLNS